MLVSRLLTGVGRDPSLNAFAKTLPGTAATLQYSGERLPRVVSSSGRTSESTFEALGFRLNGGWLCGCDMDAEGMPCSSESCSRLASPANGSSGGSRPWPRAPGEVELMLRNSDGSSWGASADTMRKRGQGPGPALPLPPQHHYHHHRGRGAGPSTRRSLDNSWASPSDRATAHDPWASLDPSRDRPPRPNPLRSILREVGSSAQALAEKVKRAAANPALAVPSSSSSRPGNGFAAAADGVLQALRRGSRSLGPSDAGGTYQPLSTTERVPLSTAGGSSSSSMRSAVKRNSKSD